MSWRIAFSKDAVHFLEENDLKAVVTDKVKAALKKFNGEEVNLDIKKLGGDWEGFYRIRTGKIRILLEFRFDRSLVFVERIDWRGNVYK